MNNLRKNYSVSCNSIYISLIIQFLQNVYWFVFSLLYHHYSVSEEMFQNVPSLLGNGNEIKFLTFGDHLVQVTQNHYCCSIVHGHPKQADGLSICHSGCISVVPESTSQLAVSARQLWLSRYVNKQFHRQERTGLRNNGNLHGINLISESGRESIICGQYTRVFNSA